MIACAVAGFARPLLLGAGPLFPMHTEAVGWQSFVVCIVAGLLSGMLSAGMSSALYKVEDWFGKLPVHWMWWPAIGAIAVGVGGYFQPRALGVGYDVIADLLNNHIAVSVALSLLCVKAVIWVIALGSGTSGGVLAPLLMLGAGLGVVIASLVPGTDPTLWPLVCMAAVLAGVLGAPLTASIFALGLTGDFNALLPLLLATGVSYGFTVLAMPRSIMTEKIARRGLHIYREYSVDPQERAFVDEVMTTDVISIGTASSLAVVAAQYFGANQHHRSFPVVAEQGAFVGMIDREALIQGLKANDEQAPVSILFDDKEPCVALPTETCQSAGRRMAVKKLERLAVVADKRSRRLIGIVSRSDLVKPSHQVFHEEHVRERLFDSNS
jgi:CBS domain-containing protein